MLLDGSSLYFGVGSAVFHHTVCFIVVSLIAFSFVSFLVISFVVFLVIFTSCSLMISVVVSSFLTFTTFHSCACTSRVFHAT